MPSILQYGRRLLRSTPVLCFVFYLLCCAAVMTVAALAMSGSPASAAPAPSTLSLANSLDPSTRSTTTGTTDTTEVAESDGSRSSAPQNSAQEPDTAESTATATDPEAEPSQDATAASAPVTTGNSDTSESAEPGSPSTLAAPTTNKPATTTAPSSPTTSPPAAPATTTATTSPPQPVPAGSAPCASGDRFELVMRDDFDGQSLAAHWNVYHSPGNASFGLRRPSAIEVSDGRLVITAANNSDGVLVSGGMAHRYTQQYGKYRFRVRTDADPTMATSGVVLTWPRSEAFPRDGENDIYETTAQSPDRNPFFSFIHEPFGMAADQVALTHNADGTQFQIMTMEWTPETITIRREGPGSGTNQVTTTEMVVTETSDDLIPDNPHKLTVQLDAWAHSTSAVVQMEVDWVEVYTYCDEAKGAGYLGGQVASTAGGGASGVEVDLFEATADWSRGRYLRSATTDGQGAYGFTVAPDCYVLVAVAPTGSTFEDGARWHQEHHCVDSNETNDAVHAVLRS